jgi:hypothetical protein
MGVGSWDMQNLSDIYTCSGVKRKLKDRFVRHLQSGVKEIAEGKKKTDEKSTTQRKDAISGLWLWVILQNILYFIELEI